VASALGVCAGLVGLYLSYYAGVAAGAAIAGTIVATYLVALAATSLHSLTQRTPATTGAAS
jgi:ABC-type Mn2+/Zn2+ transport system permease subunit